mmetsp:Transcript_8432/g.17197  ORF Transcript_8432/g.17197 Transcript_8432/m.17197 type:complete len:258 (+) Transcript_8432:592-1365(+)
MTKNVKVKSPDLQLQAGQKRAKVVKIPTTRGGSWDRALHELPAMFPLSSPLQNRRFPHLDYRLCPLFPLNLQPDIQPFLRPAHQQILQHLYQPRHRLPHQPNRQPFHRPLLQPIPQPIFQQMYQPLHQPLHQHLPRPLHHPVNQALRHPSLQLISLPYVHPSLLPLQLPHLLFQQLRSQHFLQQSRQRIIQQPAQSRLLRCLQQLPPSLLLQISQPCLPQPLPPSSQLFHFQHFLQQCHQQKVQQNQPVHPQFQLLE